ncbi:hypothetical protein ACF05L_22600 [Streptomyces bobili]|uniref:hypothetical protein n=1 Tax=Streptomyces bobili TaxID=67280 RepID=UPI0036F8C83A
MPHRHWPDPEPTDPTLKTSYLAFHVEDDTAIDRLATDAARHGWHLTFPDRHPHAGGAQHYAAYLENDDGFEVELVAINPSQRNRDQPIHRS